MSSNGRPSGGEIVHVVGARPNFVKMAPIIEALAQRDGVDQYVVHTGQHYDERMSGEMLTDLQFPEPDLFLGIGSGTHGAQTGRALIEFEEVLLEVMNAPMAPRPLEPKAKA